MERARLARYRWEAMVAAVVVLSVAASPSGSAADQDLLNRGKAVFATRCEDCHGKAGGGDGPTAVRLRFHPRDLRRSAYKCRCTASGELPSDEDLQRTIANGMPGTPMLAHGDLLTAEEIAAVVQYVKSLSPRFAREAQPACVANPEPTTQTAETVAEGALLYRLVECWQCHGRSGKGDGPAAQTLVDDFDRPVRPRRFRAGKFLCGNTRRDLYRTLTTGMNGSPMPSFEAAMAFAGDKPGDLAGVRRQFGDDAATALSRYLASQPDTAVIAALSAEERVALVSRRLWALADYIESLAMAAPVREAR